MHDNDATPPEEVTVDLANDQRPLGGAPQTPAWARPRPPRAQQSGAIRAILPPGARQRTRKTPPRGGRGQKR